MAVGIPNSMYSALDQTLYYLCIARYATLNNLYSRDAKTTKGALLQARANIRKLLELELVRQLNTYGERFRSQQRTFYAPTKKAYNKLGLSAPALYYDKTDAPYILEHESAKIDIVMSFLKLFPDKIVEVEYPSFGPAASYKPDIQISVSNRDMTGRRQYLVEFEKKAPKDLCKVKAKCDMFARIDLKTLGLNPKTQILIVYAPSYYDVYARPMEYDPDMITDCKGVFGKLMQLARGYDNDRFRFMPFYDFFKLDKAVWFKPNWDKFRIDG